MDIPLAPQNTPQVTADLEAERDALERAIHDLELAGVNPKNINYAALEDVKKRQAKAGQDCHTR